MKSRYLESNIPSLCYGCSMCEAKCPTYAIEMRRNSQGFFYPVVDESKCVDCEICKKVCPFEMDKSEADPIIYQVAHKDVEVLLRSQCGGAFTAISDYVLEQNGVVYGAIIDDADFSVKHIRADKVADRDKMSGSKYVQSLITAELIVQIENDLKNGKMVLFSGTPCQCAMVKKNYNRYENLVVCDFICHGVPSPELWRRYLKHVASKHSINISKVVFRNKRCRKVGNHTESYWSEDGIEYLENDYAALFYSHLAHRESCFECQFADIHRYADITIAGFLEPSDFESKYDSSMLVVNTQKGDNVFKIINKNMYWNISKLDFYKNQPCLYHPIPKPNEYEAFWEDWKIQDMDRIIDEYATDYIKDKFHIRIMNPGEDY